MFSLLLTAFASSSTAVGVQDDLTYSGKATASVEKHQDKDEKELGNLKDEGHKKDHGNGYESENKPEKYTNHDAQNASAFEGFSVSQPMFSEQKYTDRLAEKKRGPVVVSVDNEEYVYLEQLISYKSMLDDVRFGLGDEVYSKLVWTYYDLKDLDDSIYSNIAEYDLKARNLLGKMQQFIGVEEQFNAMMIFGNFGGALGKSSGANGGDRKDAHKEASDKVVLDFSARNLERKEAVDPGWLHAVFRYLTLVNIVYVLVIILGIGAIWRAFRFFLKQDLN